MLASDGSIEEREASTGLRGDDGQIEIRSGLSEGEKISRMFREFSELCEYASTYCLSRSCPYLSEKKYKTLALRKCDVFHRPREFVALMGPSDQGSPRLCHLLGPVDQPTTFFPANTVLSTDRLAKYATRLGGFPVIQSSAANNSFENVELRCSMIWHSPANISWRLFVRRVQGVLASLWLRGLVWGRRRIVSEFWKRSVRSEWNIRPTTLPISSPVGNATRCYCARACQ